MAPPRIYKNTLHEWWMKATIAERELVTHFAGISPKSVALYIYTYRKTPIDKAIVLAAAARRVRETLGGEALTRLPDVQRGDVPSVCTTCPFFIACRQNGIREAAPRGDDTPTQ